MQPARSDTSPRRTSKEKNFTFTINWLSEGFFWCCYIQYTTMFAWQAVETVPGSFPLRPNLLTLCTCTNYMVTLQTDSYKSIIGTTTKLQPQSMYGSVHVPPIYRYASHNTPFRNRVQLYIMYSGGGGGRTYWINGCYLHICRDAYIPRNYPSGETQRLPNVRGLWEGGGKPVVEMGDYMYTY